MIKATARRGRIVAVVASETDLHRALRLRCLPDLFELRLDALCDISELVLAAVPKLRAPLIVTARHPLEGGLNQLPAAKRRSLLSKFLPLAAFVDVELRSAAQLEPVLEAARDLQVGRILSLHDLRDTPELERLERLAATAQKMGADIFKLATRTHTDREATRLLDFFRSAKELMPLSVMSIGRGSRELRLTVARDGSALNYTHLGNPQAEGQWSLRALRHALQSRG